MSIEEMNTCDTLCEILTRMNLNTLAAASLTNSNFRNIINQVLLKRYRLPHTKGMVRTNFDLLYADMNAIEDKDSSCYVLLVQYLLNSWPSSSLEHEEMALSSLLFNTLKSLENQALIESVG